MKKPVVVLLLIVYLSLASRVSATDDGDAADLWVDLSMGAPLVDLFNERAQPQDIARVEHISQLDLLEGVHAGKKLVVFKSAADAIRLLPHIHDKIDIVGYNLEHGPANPIFEQENPLESIQQLREVVDRYDLELALGPDHRFAESDGAALAPYADYFILQVQKVQTEPETVFEFVDPLIDQIRAANPEIEISLQIRTEGDVEQLLALFTPLGDRVQGISILTSEDTLDVTEDIMKELRPSARLITPEPTAEVVDISVSILTPQPLPTIEPGNNAPIREELLDESEPTPEPTEIVTTPEATERGGSTALFVVMALVVGIALGAGYVSHRTGS